MKRGSSWPIAVTVILGLTVGSYVWLARLANSDASFAIEDDYYQKAVHWDDELAQRRHNKELGWRLTSALTLGSASRAGTLDVLLRDRAGAPLTGARIDVTAVHNAAAAHGVAGTLVESSPGSYRASLPLQRAGLWELRFDVHRGGDHFTADLRVDAARVDRGP